jgi:DNA-binding NtrC family response regulator
MDRAQFQKKLGIIGESDEIKEIIDVIFQVAPTEITVLLTGESGVGKEVFARAIHTASKRADKPLVTVNCGAIPEGLIESELFGHEKGAFTSASETRKGYFEIGDGGTIFLDEIGETPLATQVRLLRVLENGEYMRVGSSTPRHTDVRIIAATNKNLETEVHQKRFRSDLYYRLRSVSIELPPLRARKEDIPLLVESIIREFAGKHGIQFLGFSDDATETLMSYNWPGNIRELRNVIESVIVLTKDRKVTADDILKHLNSSRLPELERNLPVVTHKTVEQAERELIYRALVDLKANILDLKTTIAQTLNDRENGRDANMPKEHAPSLSEIEVKTIRHALERNRGNKRRTARELKISERTLYRKIKEFGLEN